MEGGREGGGEGEEGGGGDERRGGGGGGGGSWSHWWDGRATSWSLIRGRVQWRQNGGRTSSPPSSSSSSSPSSWLWRWVEGRLILQTKNVGGGTNVGSRLRGGGSGGFATLAASAFRLPPSTSANITCNHLPPATCHLKSFLHLSCGLHHQQLPLPP